MQDLNLLSQQIEKAVKIIDSLKKENKRLSSVISQQEQTIKFLEKENKEFQKVVANNNRWEKQRNEIKERLLFLVTKIEEFIP